MTTLAPSVSPELARLMRRLKLGRLLDTLPERLALARSHHLGAGEFLEQLFSDEVCRRDAESAGLRARKAHLDPTMTLERWDDTSNVTYDRSGSARPSSPRRSLTRPCAGARACTSSAATDSSSA